MEAGGSAQPPTVGSRRPSRQVLAIAGTAVLALVVGVIVAAVIFSGRERPPADPSGSASNMASAATSGVASNTEPSPSVSPQVTEGSLLQATVTGLRLRMAASTSAEVIRTFELGEVVRVVSGPAEADGYAWYEVIDLDSGSGWAALGPATEPWLEAVPRDPATSALLLRLERDCDVSLRSMGTPVVPADVTLTADGRVLLLNGVARQLSPSGVTRVQQDVLRLPALQTSASYDLELRPGVSDPPGHGICSNAFTVGEGAARVVVSAVNRQSDDEEAAFWAPSPERFALDELAIHLLDIETWLGPAAWTEPVGRRYVGNSYEFWLDRAGETPPPDVDAQSVSGVAWPFDGPIEQFGRAIGPSRCGYLDLGQAFETLRLMRAQGVTTYPFFSSREDLWLDGFGSGNFTTDAGWFTFWLTPRSPDGYPACPAFLYPP